MVLRPYKLVVHTYICKCTLTQIPVWPVHGREYPYYSVKMGGGDACDIKDNTPRSVVIRYICDQEAYKHGAVSKIIVSNYISISCRSSYLLLTLLCLY